MESSYRSGIIAYHKTDVLRDSCSIDADNTLPCPFHRSGVAGFTDPVLVTHGLAQVRNADGRRFFRVSAISLTPKISVN